MKYLPALQSMVVSYFQFIPALAISGVAKGDL
jgi:hypothetical protein